MKKLLNHGIFVGALAAATVLPLIAQQTQTPYQTQNPYQNQNQYQSGQTPYSSGETNSWGTNSWGGGTNESRRAQWRAFHQQMATEIKQQDQELEQLLTQMNNAPADQKTDAIAALVSKLVSDRLALHQEFEAFHQQMMGTNAPPEEGGTNAAPPVPPTP